MIGLKTDMVKLIPYTNEWTIEFNKEKNKLIELLSDYSINIQHVGSTSIVGCSAKPIIDIFIGIESLDIANKFIPILKANGYINKFNVQNEIYFKKVSNGLTTHHIHIAEMYGEIYNNQIGFRDYLNNNPEKLKEYIELKAKLAFLFPNDRDSYSIGKNEFIKNTIFEANNNIQRKR